MVFSYLSVFYIPHILPLAVLPPPSANHRSAVYLIAFQQFLMSSDAIYLSVIQDKDLICMTDRGNTLSNDDLGHIRQIFLHPLADPAFCSSIHSAGGVIPGSRLSAFLKAPWQYTASVSVLRETLTPPVPISVS